MTEELQSLLIGAAESPPNRRDEWLDAIAGWGPVAIGAVASWLYDGDLAPFAVRVMRRAAELGHFTAAREALLDVDLSEVDDTTRWSVEGALDALGIQREGKPTQAAPRPTISLLESGQLYRRSQLHDSGLGGDRQKGISYRTDREAVLLFSGGKSGALFGYEDGWQDEGTYRYYGEWRGPGDMRLKWGNAQIIEKSPFLLLFTRAPNGMWRFEGRFEYVSHATVPTERAGVGPAAGLVFTLRRAASSYAIP